MGSIISMDDGQRLETDIQRLKSYSLALEGTRIGMWDWNVESGELTINERWAEICGYTLDELAPISIKTWQALAHPDDLAESNRHLQRHFSGEAECYDLECRMRHKDGRWIWVHDRGVVSEWTADGLPARISGTHMDISKKRKAEERLEHVSRIQQQLMYLATAFVNISIERKDEAINDALAKIGDLIGADRAYLFRYDFKAKMMDNTHEWCGQGISPEKDNLQKVPMDIFPEWVEAHRKGNSYHIPNITHLEEGSNLREVLEPQGIQSLVTLPLKYHSECYGFVGFDAVRECRSWTEEEIGLLRVLAEMFTNLESRSKSEEMLTQLNAEQASLIKEMQSLQDNLVAARDEAQTASHAKSMFLANMSHEIRTPLNAVLGYAQILGRNCSKSLMEDDLRGLDVIISSGQHLLRLINDLLALSRNENQQVELNKNTFALPQLIDEACLLSRNHSSNTTEIIVEYGHNMPKALYSDEGKIRQVLVNLIGNAIKFTPQGWVKVTVTTPVEDLAVFESGATGRDVPIAVCVEDSGMGIEPDKLEIIFEIFEQANAGSEMGKGSGLGLAISRKYAHVLGGDIKVESKRGEGSKFLFTFEATYVRNDMLNAERKVLGLKSSDTSSRLLLVEDDPVGLDMLKNMLAGVGFETVAVGDGKQAMEVLKQDTNFAAILLDKKMPVMDGVSFLKKMDFIPVKTIPPVIVLTASGLSTPHEEALMLKLGAAGFVPKPIQEEHLLAEIKRVSSVDYIYEPDVSGGGIVELGLNSEEHSPEVLPPDLADDFQRAIQHGRIREIRDLIEAVREYAPAFANRAVCLMDQYNYKELIERLKKVGKVANDTKQ